MFSTRLKEMLKLRGVSQYALAKKLGVVKQTVNNWYTERAEPSFDMLLKICKILDESPNYMLGYED